MWNCGLAKWLPFCPRGDELTCRTQRPNAEVNIALAMMDDNSADQRRGQLPLQQWPYVTMTTSWYDTAFHGTGTSLQSCHNERNYVSNYLHLDCLLNRLFTRRSKTTSKLGVTGLSEGISPMTGKFLTQRARNAENVSIWWRCHMCGEHAGYCWIPLSKLQLW